MLAALSAVIGIVERSVLKVLCLSLLHVALLR